MRCTGSAAAGGVNATFSSPDVANAGDGGGEIALRQARAVRIRVQTLTHASGTADASSLLVTKLDSEQPPPNTAQLTDGQSLPDDGCPHQMMFREAFGDLRDVAGELQAILPAELYALLDVSTLRQQSETFLDSEERADMYGDALYEIDIAGERGYIYFLFEHRSTGQRIAVLRLLSYMTRIWRQLEDEQPLPPIIPVLFHHDARGWRDPTRLGQLLSPLALSPAMERFTPDFEVLLDDLAHVDNQQLKSRTLSSFCKLAFWLLRDGRNSGKILADLDDWAEEFTNVANEENAVDAQIRLFKYIARITSNEECRSIKRRILSLTQAPSTEKAMISHAEVLERQGIAKGKAEGRQEDILGVLEARKLPVTAEQRDRIRSCADLETLARWVRRAVTAQSTSELFED